MCLASFRFAQVYHSEYESLLKPMKQFTRSGIAVTRWQRQSHAVYVLLCERAIASVFVNERQRPNKTNEAVYRRSVVC